MPNRNAGFDILGHKNNFSSDYTHQNRFVLFQIKSNFSLFSFFLFFPEGVSVTLMRCISLHFV